MRTRAKTTKDSRGLTSAKATQTPGPGELLDRGPGGGAGSVWDPRVQGQPQPSPGVPGRFWVLGSERLSLEKNRTQENTLQGIR